MTADPHAPHFLPVLNAAGEPDVIAALCSHVCPPCVYAYLLTIADWTRGTVQFQRDPLARKLGISRSTLSRRLAVLRGANPLMQPWLYPLPRPALGQLRFRLALQSDIQRARRARRRAHLQALPAPPQSTPSPPTAPAREASPPSKQTPLQARLAALIAQLETDGDHA